MQQEIKDAITFLSKKITGEIKSDDALKYTQAALNLAHTDATIANTDKVYRQSK